MYLNYLTIIIVAYKPKKKLLKSIILRFKDKCRFVIINNSINKLENFFYEYTNVEIIDSKVNLGNGAGINAGLNKCNTKFALYMDIDTLFTNENLKKLIKYSNRIKKFGVLVPNGSNKNSNSKITKMWKIEGSVILINKDYINSRVKFDENYFLYFEETDFFYNCLKNNIEVFFIPKVKFFHQRSSSIEFENIYKKRKIIYLRQWHYMWSKFYFFKKNFGYFTALKKNILILAKDFIMLIFYLIKFDELNFKIRYSRIAGLVFSILCFKSKKRL